MHERNPNQTLKPRKHGVKTLAAVLTMAALATAGMSPVADEVTGTEHSAWDVLVAERPQVVDDGTVTPIERRILQLLTPAQADELSQGRDPGRIELADGQTLAEIIARIQREDDAGLVFKPVVPCTVLDTRETGQPFSDDETRVLKLRGADSDGSAADGCGIPGLHGRILRTNRARSVFLTVRVVLPEGEGDLRIWPANDHPQPQVGLIDYGADPAQTYGSSIVVSLCDEIGADPCAAGDVKVRMHGAGAHLVLSVLGWFEPVRSPHFSAVGEIGDASALPKSLTEPFWEQTADPNDIHYSDGNVGIGTAAPTRLLQVGDLTQDEARLLFGKHSLSLQGIADRDRLPYFEMRDENDNRAFYLGWGSKTSKTIEWKFENGYHLNFVCCKVAFGNTWPQRTVHIEGGFQLSNSAGILIDTEPRSHLGYSGSGAHSMGVLEFFTPYEDSLGAEMRSSIVYGSPEIWGAESSYFYSFGNKNLRLGTVDDGQRRSEIELYNDDTASGKILFRTGGWQDSGNVPGAAINVRMMIDDNGYVGINTTSPQEQLEVDGNFKLTGNIIPAGDICIGNCN